MFFTDVHVCNGCNESAFDKLKITHKRLSFLISDTFQVKRKCMDEDFTSSGRFIRERITKDY